MHAVVISFDRLHLGYLGCYGNDWIETPNLDRLATASVLFDQHYGENFDPYARQHAWWTGRYQFPPAAKRLAQPGLADWLRDAGVTTHLFVEATHEADTRVAPAFDEVATILGSDGLEVAEVDAPFARLVAQASTWLKGRDRAAGATPSLLWLMSRGVPPGWLPPREFVDLYFSEFGLEERPDDDEFDDDDERKPTSLEDAHSPEDLVAEPIITDPAIIERRYARALYAAYATYLDRWLGKLLAVLDRQAQAKETLVLFAASGGDHLGEHGPITASPPLREELIHAPLLVRCPGQAAGRRPAFVQSVDLAPTLAAWFGCAPPADRRHGQSLLPLIRGEPAVIRESACVGSPEEWGLRNDDFYYVVGRSNRLAAGQLFVKPHDRWDFADVRPQYSDQADELDRILRAQIETLSGPADG